jgi:hypothetical protein
MPITAQDQPCKPATSTTLSTADTSPVCRFLLTDPDTGTTILHTGDVRPDRPFLDRLERHPAVMPYLAKIMGMDTVQRGTDADDVVSGVFKTQRLERVYLDTSAVYVFLRDAS